MHPESMHSGVRDGPVAAPLEDCRGTRIMSRRTRQGSSRRRPLRRGQVVRLAFEPLEDRLMLDAAPDIVVGRTLSSYTVGDIQGGRETITYTVYNERADALTGVLLTTSLAPGVAF